MTFGGARTIFGGTKNNISFFLASSQTKNSKSEKTNKHTIWIIYPKKRFEHMLFSKVIIIAFAHKKKYSYYTFLCKRVRCNN
jgi:hypothetical protein